MWEARRELMRRRSRKAKKSTRYGLARAGTRRTPEQMARKAERVREAKGRKRKTNGTSSHEQKTKRLRRLVREGTKACEGKERTFS